jgi:hypothetical protein
MPLDAWPSLFLLPLELPGISLANLEFFFHATDGASDWGCVIVARKTKQRHLGLGESAGNGVRFSSIEPPPLSHSVGSRKLCPIAFGVKEPRLLGLLIPSTPLAAPLL